MRRLALPLLIAAGCSGHNEAVGTSGRGDDPCVNYQDSLCDWVLRCTPHVTRAQCEASASSIVCQADGRAEACTSAIDAASCQEPPDDCELFDVADRAPARQACVEYADALCAARVACGAQTAVACQAELEALDCGSVVGVKRGYQQCLEHLQSPSCDAVPPATCDDILLAEPSLPAG